MGPLVNFIIRRQIFLGREVKKSLDWLDLKPDELRITGPPRTDGEATSAEEEPHAEKSSLLAS